MVLQMLVAVESEDFAVVVEAVELEDFAAVDHLEGLY